MVGIVGELPYVLRTHSFDSLRLSCSSIVCSIGECGNTMGNSVFAIPSNWWGWSVLLEDTSWGE